jgi:hypothetical protein
MGRCTEMMESRRGRLITVPSLWARWTRDTNNPTRFLSRQDFGSMAPVKIDQPEAFAEVKSRCRLVRTMYFMPAWLTVQVFSLPVGSHRLRQGVDTRPSHGREVGS